MAQKGGERNSNSRLFAREKPAELLQWVEWKQVRREKLALYLLIFIRCRLSQYLLPVCGARTVESRLVSPTSTNTLRRGSPVLAKEARIALVAIINQPFRTLLKSAEVASRFGSFSSISVRKQGAEEGVNNGFSGFCSYHILHFFFGDWLHLGGLLARRTDGSVWAGTRVDLTLLHIIDVVSRCLAPRSLSTVPLMVPLLEPRCLLLFCHNRFVSTWNLAHLNHRLVRQRSIISAHVGGEAIGVVL